MMPDRLSETMAVLKKRGEKAVVPFLVLGYPDRRRFLEAAKALIEGGATALELGLPFSDPLADGPIIENADRAVLESGQTVDQALELIGILRELAPPLPLSLLTYFNPMLKRGIPRFLSEMKESGIDGMTIVDLPPEEYHEVEPHMKDLGLAPVMLVSPLTAGQRLRTVCAMGAGFVYLVSRAGITGLSSAYQGTLRDSLEAVREQTPLPVLVGFGITRSEQARSMVAMGADGVIVGSKIIDIIDRCEEGEMPHALTNFVSDLKNAMSYNHVS
ncbi:MAG: tryptophan synthase subunit alpha [Candidatus Melainabacteria bacterium]|nr:tryptophan synthase subunit alpha [Candidatus Melainabacteria bacterium]